MTVRDQKPDVNLPVRLYDFFVGVHFFIGKIDVVIE